MSVIPPSTTASAPTTPAAPGQRTFATRYRLMRSRWNEEWWSVAMGGPIGNVINALIGDVAWITPNRITLAGFVAKLAAVPALVVGGPGALIAAAILLQVSVICDCMDGSLARYRKRPSALGAYLDKITDAIGYTAVFGAFGWRVHLDTGDDLALVFAFVIPATLLIRGYVYWVVAALEKQADAEASTGIDKRKDFSTATARERAAMYVRSMPRVVEFAESDLFFWLGLALVLGEPWLQRSIYFLTLATGCWFIGILTRRTLRVLELDRKKPTT